MLSTEDRFALAKKSMEALNRIKSVKTENINTPLTYKNPNYAKVILEEYDEKEFANKVKLDAAYYKVLLKRIDESQSENIHLLLSNLTNTVREIYEHINIKPKVYGLNRLPSLDETDSVIEETATRIISDYINRSYYQLSHDQRQNKFGTCVKSLASDMVLSESIDPEDAIRFSTKTTVIEQFLESINFPLVIKSEIETCFNSDEYKDMFEQDQLKELWESFKDQTRNLAKIVAAVI